MDTSVIEVPESTVAASKDASRSKTESSPDRVAEKRADAVRATKKKKRDAHRVALRRSHTNG